VEQDTRHNLENRLQRERERETATTEYVISGESGEKWHVMSKSWANDAYEQDLFKEMVHFKIKFWYVLAYLKGIQDVGVFVSTVFSILIFLGQTVLVCQS